jgi:crossover junction endodeoxyribonuclease RuvC
MRILGIDPGIGRVGWGIIDKKGQKLKLVKYGCIETLANSDSISRLKTIQKQLKTIIKKFKPDESAVEKLFFNSNAKTVMKVGEARGVILITLAGQKLPIYHYTPLQIKVTTTNYGRADKTQVQKMVKTILDLDVIPKPDDAADAVAAAITHASTTLATIATP